MKFTWTEPPAFRPARLVPTKWGGHYYRAPDGTVFPSVTTMNNKIEPFEGSFGQKKYHENLGGAQVGSFASKYTLGKGSWLHWIIEQFLRNRDISNFQIPAPLQQAFGNIVPYLINISDIQGCEVPMYSYTMRLAGTADCIAKYYGIPSVIDFKTSTKEKKESDIQNYFIQATAYARMWEEMTSQHISQIVILVSCDTGQRQEFIKKSDDYTAKLNETLSKFEVLR